MITVIVATFGTDAWLRAGLATGAHAGRQAEDVFVEHRAEGPVEDVRNHAASEAKGDWLCFLDADDKLAPKFIWSMDDAISQGDERRLLAPYVSFDGKPPLIPNGRHTMPPMNHCVVGTLIHRKLFKESGGFRSEFWPWSDYELWLRCSRRGAVVEYVPGAVYRVKVNHESDNNTLTRAEGQKLGKRIHDEHKAAGGDWPIEGGQAHR